MLSLHAPDVAAPAPPPWLDAPPPSPPESVWGVPRAWLHGLADLDRLPVPLGGVALKTPRLSLRVDGLLRLSADYPSLGGHVDLDTGGHHLQFVLPSLQVVPRRQAGQLYFEVNLVFFERRF